MGETPQSVTTPSPALLPEQTDEKLFPVMEIFGPTLQGEGAVIGLQTMFIRFGGCDYRCRRCDSLHAVLPDLIHGYGKKMSAEDIYNELKSKAGHCRTVTLSGGNPVIWNLGELTSRLQREGWQVCVETQGTIWRNWLYDVNYLTISPKGPGMGERFEYPKLYNMIRKWQQAYPHYNADHQISLKVVIFDQEDIEFAKTLHVWEEDIPMYLSVGNPWPPAPAERSAESPEYTLQDALMHRMSVLYEDIKNEPALADVRFLPQMHVLLWGNERGR